MTKTVLQTWALILGIAFSSLSWAETIQLRNSQGQYPITFDYDRPNDASSANFVVRSGYSRDNDDAWEGGYETAVFDLEVVGKKINGGIALYLVTTASLSSEDQNAENWVRRWVTRMVDTQHYTATGWVNYTPQERPASFEVIHHNRAPFMLYGKAPAGTRGLQQKSLRSTLFLGAVPDGSSAGMVYLQDGSLGIGDAASDERNYNKVRHVLQWVVRTQNGIPVNIGDVVRYGIGKDKDVVGFPSQIRFLTPSWNGSWVPDDRGGGENKYHSVSLMWKDVVTENPLGTGYQKTDLYEVTKSAAQGNPLKLPMDEKLGQLRVKGSTQPPRQNVRPTNPSVPRGPQFVSPDEPQDEAPQGRRRRRRG